MLTLKYWEICCEHLIRMWCGLSRSDLTLHSLTSDPATRSHRAWVLKTKELKIWIIWAFTHWCSLWVVWILRSCTWLCSVHRNIFWILLILVVLAILFNTWNIAEFCQQKFSFSFQAVAVSLARPHTRQMCSVRVSSLHSWLKRKILVLQYFRNSSRWNDVKVISMASKLSTELDQSVRSKVQWQNLPIHLKQVRIEKFVVFIFLPFFCCDSSRSE